MEELNKFRQFINEGKENVDELFGLRGKSGEAEKAAKALDALEKALFELNFLDILGQEDYEDWLIKYEKLRGRVMAGLEDSDRKKYDVAYGSAEGDLDENDAALDEVINEKEESFFGKLKRNVFGGKEPLKTTEYPPYYYKGTSQNLIDILKEFVKDDRFSDAQKKLIDDFKVKLVMGDSSIKNIFSKDKRYGKKGFDGGDRLGLWDDKSLSASNEFKQLRSDVMGQHPTVKAEMDKDFKAWQDKYGKSYELLFPSELFAPIQKKLNAMIQAIDVGRFAKLPYGYEAYKWMDDKGAATDVYRELFEDKDQNDSVLDEIINEAKPNLKKALPTIAARNVERNNLINADIEDMMDMVGEAGKGEGSEEAEILFKASNASSDLEQALTDLQMYFEDDLGEGKEEE